LKKGDFFGNRRMVYKKSLFAFPLFSFVKGRNGIASKDNTNGGGDSDVNHERLKTSTTETVLLDYLLGYGVV
jgi:hypothetical protein